MNTVFLINGELPKVGGKSYAFEYQLKKIHDFSILPKSNFPQA